MTTDTTKPALPEPPYRGAIQTESDGRVAMWPAAYRNALDREFRAGARAALASAAEARAVPAGWKLVPCEPTREMIAAVDLEAEDKYLARGRAVSAWVSMLAAAPSPAEQPCAQAHGYGEPMLSSVGASASDGEQPGQQQAGLTEKQLVACIVEAECLGTVKLTYETGPYDITRPTLNANKLARAILRAAGIGQAQGEQT